MSDATHTHHRTLPVGNSERLRWWLGAGGLVMLLAAAVLLRFWMVDPRRLPVRHVEIIGTLDYADRPTLQAIVTEHVREGFAGLDMRALRTMLEAEPWVAQARISRRGPDQVLVEVDEYRPVARWNDNALISSRLVVFKPPQLQTSDARYLEWRALFATLPALEGVDGRESAVLQAWRNYQQRLGALGLQVERLAEDQRLSRTLQLANGITVRLGRQALEERIARFIDVYASLTPAKARGPAVFDMRYVNGFAWKGPDAAGSLLPVSRDS